MTPTTTIPNDLTTRQRHQLGAALDCFVDGGSHLAQLASGLPLAQRITVLLCLALSGRIESRLAHLLAMPTPEPASATSQASSATADSEAA